MLHFIWLVFVGFVVGGVGTLVGAGGGFMLVPYLILAEGLRTHLTVSTSLAVVFFNALSGSIAYRKQKRVDYKTGIRFALYAIPGALLGTYLTVYIGGETFRIIFSVLLLAVVYRMLGGPMWRKKVQNHSDSVNPSASDTVSELESNPQLDEDEKQDKLSHRHIIDAKGNEYKYSFSQKKGNILSFFVGIYSGLFGVGGGILHVPIMVGILSFPVHIATATSHFVLVFTSLVSTVYSVVTGRLAYQYVISLALGVVLGAQLGAAIAPKVNDRVLKIVLAVLLVITSIKMVWI